MVSLCGQIKKSAKENHGKKFMFHDGWFRFELSINFYLAFLISNIHEEL
jgi:hypothetical protein